MVSLSVLDQHESGTIEGAGFVAAKFEIDEDEGQEDDLEDNYGEPQYIRLSAVRRYGINYLVKDWYVYRASLSILLLNSNHLTVHFMLRQTTPFMSLLRPPRST